MRWANPSCGDAKGAVFLDTNPAPPGGNGQEAGGRPSVAQANLFFLFALLLGLATAGMQARAGLLGVPVSQVLIFGALPLVLAVFSRLPLAETFRLRRVGARTIVLSLVAGVVGWAIAQAVSVVIVVIVSRFGGQPFNPYAPLLQSGGPPWLVLAVMAVVPALMEELAFRGFVVSAYTRLGPRMAWIGPGLLFAAMHGSLIRLPGLAVLGLVFSYVGVRTASVYPSMWMHFGNNTVALLLALSAGPAGQPALAPGTTLPWLSAVWAAIVAAALVPLLLAVLAGLDRPAGGEAAPRDPDPPLLRWWPLLPASLVLLMLFWSDLSRAWPGSVP